MDQALLALIQTAESGHPCPTIRIVVNGGWIAIGTPRAAADFHASNKSAFEQGAWLVHDESKDMRRVELEEKRRIFWEGMASFNAAFGAAAQADQPGQPSAITLSDVELWSPPGDGLRVPALRIPFEAVSGWWIDGAETIQTGSTTGSRSWFIGGAVPLGGE